MSNQDLIKELLYNDKWLTKEYKQSKYYKDYVQTICKNIVD